VHPATARRPACSIWPDIFGLRPAFRQMGKRLAESGYSVLVVNPFYRVKKAPTADKVLQPRSRTDAARDGPERDDAYDRCEGVHRVARSAAVGGEEPQDGRPGILHGRTDGVPHRGGDAERIGAVGSFHGGGLVTDMPNSPHLQAAKTKAQFLIAIAANDDMRSPNEKNVLKETFEKAKLPAEIEVYTGAAHGWCPPDSGVYNEPQAEKAWARLLVLYGKALA
jgi:carboxymethylenebutenolidase